MSESTRWLTPAERCAWLRLLAVVELLPGAMDSHLRKHAGLTLFEYQTLAMLSEEPDRTLRMSILAERTNSTLPRLSHVVTRLAARDLLVRRPSETDGRATDVVLLPAGWEAVASAAPAHVEAVRLAVLDALTPVQVEELNVLAAAILERLDPDQRLVASRD